MQWAEWAVATAWRHGRPEAWLGMSGLKSDAEMSLSLFVFLGQCHLILLFGIIRSIRPLGPLDGLMGGRFILCFLSVLCILCAKMGYVVAVAIAYDDGYGTSIRAATLMIVFQFVPQIILAIFTTIGFSWNSIKLIVYHPETLLLSSGPHFKKN